MLVFITYCKYLLLRQYTHLWMSSSLACAPPPWTLPSWPLGHDRRWGQHTQEVTSCSMSIQSFLSTWAIDPNILLPSHVIYQILCLGVIYSYVLCICICICVCNIRIYRKSKSLLKPYISVVWALGRLNINHIVTDIILHITHRERESFPPLIL